MAFDGADSLFVSDSWQNAVYRFDPADVLGGVETPIADIPATALHIGVSAASPTTGFVAQQALLDA